MLIDRQKRSVFDFYRLFGKPSRESECPPKRELNDFVFV